MKDTRKKVYSLSILTFIALFFGFICFVFIDVYDLKIFRTMQDKIKSQENVDLTGLREIQASGGYLPRLPTLARKLSHIKGDKFIVNAESNLTPYVKGLPITLLGYNKEVLPLKYYVRRLVLTGTADVRPDLIASGDEEAQKYGFIYKNLVIGSRFMAPNEAIDAIITFFESLPQNSWVHFHCLHGKGRTSMLLVMYDIMKNAPQVALEDIIKRQHLLGSVDLADTSVWVNGGYTKEQLENRKKFIENFYEFVCQRKAGGSQRWSDWHSQKALTQ